MSTSTRTPPRRVAVQIRHREPAGYRIRLGERAGDSNSLSTHAGSAFAIVYNLPAPSSQSAVALPRDGVITALSSQGGDWLAAIERTPTLIVLAASHLLSRGQRLITNLCRAFKAAGKPSLFRSLLKHLQEPCSGLFGCFEVSPIGGQVHLSRSAGSSGLVAHSDGHRGSERKIGNVRKSSGEIRNVIR